MEAADNSRIEDDLLILSSSHSTEISLRAVKNGKAGLDGKRKGLLGRVPNPGDWEKFDYETLEMMDLAYLTAATGDEFAILRGKHEDILYHGSNLRCKFEDDDVLKLALERHKYEIYGHSHPAEPIPRASLDDKRVLRLLDQERSLLISGMTGICIEFYGSL